MLTQIVSHTLVGQMLRFPDIKTFSNPQFEPVRLLPTQKVLLNESRILDRLIYKLHNQHRSSSHFRMLKLLQKYIRRLQRIEIFIQSVYETNRSLINVKEYVAIIPTLCASISDLCTKNFKLWQDHYDQVFFVPHSITIMALASRISALALIISSESSAISSAII